MEGISFLEAVKKLMQWYNIEDMPGFSYDKYLERLNQEEEDYSDSIKLETISTLLQEYDLTQENLTKIFILFCEQNIVSSNFTLYCLSEMKKSLKDFMLSVPKEVKDQLSLNIQITKGLQHVVFEQQRDFDSNETKSGLLVEKLSGQYEDENGRYLFPIFLPGNIIVGFSGRSLEPNIIKYQTNLNFGFNKTDLLYGLDLALPAITKSGYVIVVEGILDLMRCRKAGFYNTVSPCSTYLSSNHIVLLKVFTNKFLLVFDNDQGGDAATKVSEKNLDKHRLFYERIMLPLNEDPDSYGLKDLNSLANLLTSPW